VSEAPAAPVVIAIDLDNPELSDRLAALLGNVAGLRLATSGEASDVAIIASDRAERGSDEFRLTPRERDVLALLAEGCSNKEIARALGISVHTAKFHVGSLLDKFDATGRTDAVAHAARRGIIEL
jgi:DNA-binding CsgD family transcriptional regulator